MSVTRGSRLKDREFLITSKNIDNYKCIICDRNLRDKKHRAKKTCSGCSNDCLNGQWGNIERTIKRRIRDALSLTGVQK